jgi:quinol monooxygenase YgiN
MPLLQLGGIARLGHERFSNVGQHLLSSYFRGTVLPSFQGTTTIAAYTKKTYVSGARRSAISRACVRYGMGIVAYKLKSTEELIMPIIRLIFVRVVPEEAKNAEQIWKESCAPLMIQQPGCLSEKLLRSTDDPGEFISYSEWKDQQSIDAYRVSEAHEEIKKHARHLHGDRPSVKRYEVV